MSESADSGSAPPGSAEVSAEEVDALLEKVESGDIPTAEGRISDVVESYDLVAPDKIARGRMPALDRINERWVGEFQQALGELVRRSVEVSAQDVQVTVYGEWLSEFESPSSLNVLNVDPWGGDALVAVGGRLLFVLVDSYYGGAGQVTNALPRIELTPTEERLNRILVETLTSHFREAFEPVASIQFEQKRTEVNPYYASIATPSERVVVIRLDVTLNETSGAICLVLPLTLLDPVREKLAADLKTVSPESQERWYQGIREQLERTALDLTSVFLQSEISMRELVALKPGDILPIEMPKTTTLCAGGRPLLNGKFGRSRGYNAVSIVGAVLGEWTDNDQEGSHA